MPATSHLRGHPIEWDALRQRWVYCDNQEPTVESWRDRTCRHCGETAGFISAMQAAEDAESRMHTIRQRTNDGSEH